jgi:hypothetical protein
VSLYIDDPINVAKFGDIGATGDNLLVFDQDVALLDHTAQSINDTTSGEKYAHFNLS